MNRKLTKLATLCMSAAIAISAIPSVLAAPVKDATIDTNATCSLTMYKYDWTNAHKDGVWDEDSFISTGWKESYVETTLGNAVREGDANNNPDNPLGNGQTSNGYAIKGVEYSYLKVADIVTYTEINGNTNPNANVSLVLYGFDRDSTNEMLTSIGLGNGAGRFVEADSSDKLDHTKWYYTSDTLNKAISGTLADNSTTLKGKLESYVKANNGTAMPETDENGKTSVNGLPVGLYLIVETKVPEMVTSTTDPFFVSLPMTTISGNEHSQSPEGGHFWNYDVTLYPKNETGIPTLEKTVRESKDDTGKNNASDVITDGFAHNATGSMGDVMEYQVITSLPTITSEATYLTNWNYFDTLDIGLNYNKDLKDVKIEFFTDKDCTDKVATWVQDDGKFTVEYSADGRTMTVNVTNDGLKEINTGAKGNVNGKLYTGYSNYTARLTYSATIVSNNNVVIGQNANRNKVVLTWKRTSSNYFDTLVDDAHVYTFGIDLIKSFSDVDSEAATKDGMFDHVKFKVWNETDKYWVKAELNKDEGIYYVTDHVADEKDATVFVPVTLGGKDSTDYGHIMVKGLEDDAYVLTEIETANGFTLLKDDIDVVISTYEDQIGCNVYYEDTLGVLQNDPRYAFNKGTEDLTLANIPQKALSHNMLSAVSSVDGNPVRMLSDRGSANAEVQLNVTNTRGFNPPATGDHSATTIITMGTILAVSSCALIILIASKKKSISE